MDQDMEASSSKMYTPDNQLSKTKDRRENICVYLRTRPMNGFERAKNSLPVVDCPGTREVVVRSSCHKTYTFDKVFGPASKQIDVYKVVAAPLIEEVLQGYNCTVFAYGQTGTGKTFTMEGERTEGGETETWEKDPQAGIVPRAMSQLFDELRLTNSEFTVRVSLLELYNEEVYDLLSPAAEDGKPKTVRLYEDSKAKGTVHVQGMEEVIVRNKHEVYAIMERGSQMRKTASTLLNANSSRSHTIITVTVHIKESNPLGEDLMKIGKLNLVDLAGSENIGRSGAVDKRAREAGNINQSLLTLGRVITALVERAPHVPYRESKLTRLLQDSLGGKTKTSIIATVSPASINIEETLSTLDYAYRAKNIQNKPEVNQKMTKKAMLKEYTEEIERLRKDLLASREKNGIYVDKENYDRMMSQLESQDQDLSEKIQYTRSLEEKLKQNDTEMEDMRATLEEKETHLQTTIEILNRKNEEIQNLRQKLHAALNEKEEMEVLVDAHEKTETKLASEATVLLSTASETTQKLEMLHNRLERKKNVERNNYEAGHRFRMEMENNLHAVANDVRQLRVEHSQFAGIKRMELDSYHEKKAQWGESFFKQLKDMNDSFEKVMEDVKAQQIQKMEELHAAVVAGLFLDTEQVDNLKSDLSQDCEAVSKKSEVLENQVYMQSGKVKEFWDTTYLIDHATGATPQRRPYDFPRILSATSPHDRILNRFRTERMKFCTIYSDGERESGCDSPDSASTSTISEPQVPKQEATILCTPLKDGEVNENRNPVLEEEEWESDFSSKSSSSKSSVKKPQVMGPPPVTNEKKEKEKDKSKSRDKKKQFTRTHSKGVLKAPN